MNDINTTLSATNKKINLGIVMLLRSSSRSLDFRIPNNDANILLIHII